MTQRSENLALDAGGPEGLDMDATAEAERSGEVARGADYVRSLDGLRAFAVGSVFLLHLDQPHFPGGAVGVDVFFVISAYLITGLLLEREDEPRRFRNFYWRRAFRLLPALIVFSLFIATPAAIAAGEGRKVPLSILGSLFYLNDFLQAYTHQVAAAFGQTWSLAVEEQFYLVWAPLLLLVVLRFGKRTQLVLLNLLVAAGLVLLYRWGNYFLPTGHLFGLALGCLLAWGRAQGWRPSVPAVLQFASMAVLCAAMFWTPQIRVVWGTWLAARFVAAAAVVVALDVDRDSHLSKLFGWEPAVWLGVRSYGVYLYGLTLLQLIPSVTGLTLHWVAPFAIVATGVAAGLSYRYVEAPIRRRGRAWLQATSS